MSLSKALRRYISLPIVSDQSAQLVPGLGGDRNELPKKERDEDRDLIGMNLY